MATEKRLQIAGGLEVAGLRLALGQSLRRSREQGRGYPSESALLDAFDTLGFKQIATA